MWSITFSDEKNNRHWSFDKVVHVNVRIGFISVVSADGFRTKVKNDEFTKCVIEMKSEE